MKCTAIDDEPIALAIISRFCERLGGIELRTFTNPLEGMRQVRAERPDLLFLDIEMSGVNGVELARELPAGTALIFTTAYARYAVDGFELDAVDFLHKPFTFARFERAVRKVEELRRLQRMADTPAWMEQTLTLRVGWRKVPVRLADIHYFESRDTYVCIHLVDRQEILSQISMKGIQELLPEGKFLRVHKSFIVPVHRIASRTSREIVLTPEARIPVGRSYADGVLGRND